MHIKRVAAVAVLISGVFSAVARAQQVSIYATNLNGPRGLKFGPDGALYVAEAGFGGGTTTVGSCEQVPAPIGPDHGGPTARISRITGPNTRTTVVDGLPSGQTSLPSGDTLGVGDVAFLGSSLFGLIAGGGCSHGNPSTPNGVIWVDPNEHSWRYVVNLSAFLQANPVAHPEPDDFEPDGTPFSMVVEAGHFYLVEPNHGEIDVVNLGGHIERLIDLSATEGHVVPTVIADHDGAFYVGTLSTFPIQPGSASVYRISRQGEILGVMSGFTSVTGLTFDAQGRLYVLEMSTAAGFPQPGTGKIVRVSAPGQIEDFVIGLNVPTGLTIGPDGALYVSDWGAAPSVTGLGRILRVTIPD